MGSCTHSVDTVELCTLCEWLRANSSGAYRTAADAADVLERQDKTIRELRAERDEAVSALQRRREPLPATNAVPNAIEVPGYGWVGILAVRAVECAHGIGA